MINSKRFLNADFESVIMFIVQALVFLTKDHFIFFDFFHF